MARVTAEVKKQRRVEKARKGGLAVLEKYGPVHFSAIGKLGGRPTWQQALAKDKAREAELKLLRSGPGRPRKSHPETGEKKEMPAETWPTGTHFTKGGRQ